MIEQHGQKKKKLKSQKETGVGEKRHLTKYHIQVLWSHLQKCILEAECYTKHFCMFYR